MIFIVHEPKGDGSGIFPREKYGLGSKYSSSNELIQLTLAHSFYSSSKDYNYATGPKRIETY